MIQPYRFILPPKVRANETRVRTRELCSRSSTRRAVTMSSGISDDVVIITFAEVMPLNCVAGGHPLECAERIVTRHEKECCRRDVIEMRALSLSPSLASPREEMNANHLDAVLDAVLDAPRNSSAPFFRCSCGLTRREKPTLRPCSSPECVLHKRQLFPRATSGRPRAPLDLLSGGRRAGPALTFMANRF